MSGGADSLAAALLLKDEGHEVLGIHMVVTGPPVTGGGTSSSTFVEHEPQIRYINKIAKQLRIPVKIVDLRTFFHSEIIVPFVQSYLSGLTPNPCVDCNARIKFGVLLKRAIESGAGAFATGHYVELRYDDTIGRWQILRGADRKKDQSYFLYQLSQEQLELALFPLGSKTKDEVRDWLRKRGVLNLPTKESHEICFIPNNDYKEFIRRNLGLKETSGEIVDRKGQVLGQHKGIFEYTIGQRRGIGIPSSEPYYVIGIYPHENRVEIGNRDDLLSRCFLVGEVNWVSIAAPVYPVRADVQVRYRHRASPASVAVVESDKVRVDFEKPQRAITPGQSAVFYDGDLLLGGGKIIAVER